MPVYKACIGRPKAALMLTVEDYDRRYGKNSMVHPFCPSCDIQLFTHALSSPNMLASFHHPDGNPNNCRLVNPPRGRVPNLEPCHFNEEHASANRDALHQNDSVKAAYAFMWSLCGKGNFSAAQFNDCVKIADAMNVWAYRNLQQWQIPFILLTLIDFKFKDTDKGFRFTLKKKRGCSKAYWQTPESCELLKVFADTGKLAEKSSHHREQFSEDIFKNFSTQTEWMSPALVASLKSTA